MALLIFISAAFIALLFGGFVYTKPEKVIDLQKWVYSLVNWRMEPISMPKEIRSTKWMGLFLIIFTLICCTYYWLR